MLFPEVTSLRDSDGESPHQLRKTDSASLVKNRKYAAARRRGEDLVEMKKINTRSMRKKIHRIPAPQDAKLEWYFVAEVVDKTLFLLFFAAMATTITVSLIIVPYLHKDD